VVVTGAGSGIGRALAVDVAGRGDRLDVAERGAFAAHATAVAEHFGRVDVVVHNACVALAADVEDLGDADLEWIMGVDFSGPPGPEH
jgi:NAD(P)-dependent dehydrogenase (short-subunit alcohol dehydrogenase family)